MRFIQMFWGLRTDLLTAPTFTQPSLLSHLRFGNSFPTAANLVEDHIGGGLPYEGFGPVVPGGEPLVDGMLQFRDAAESASPNHPVGDQAEPAFDLIEPGAAG